MLAARVRAHLRRRDQDVQACLTFDDLEPDPVLHAVRRGSRDLILTTQEFRLLQVLMEHPGRVLSKPVLLDLGWGLDSSGDGILVEVYVKQLRQTLEAQGGPRVIHTIRHAGSVLRAD